MSGNYTRKGRVALPAIILGLIASPSIAKPAYTTFTISDAKAVFVDGLNDSGTIAGCFDTAARNHIGYLRLPDGTITVFDPVGSQLTQPIGFNNNGDVVGYFYDGTTYHGFLRTADGTITTIDPPGATRSEADGINIDGTITGTFEPGSHGYLRAPNGSFTIFDAPGAHETLPQAINDNGDVTGSAYFSSNLVNPSGFIRTADGALTLFNAPGSNAGTIPTAINNSGRIVGWYEPIEYTANGFDRAPDGKIQTFTFPKSVSLFTGGMNASGSFVGAYYDRAIDSNKTSEPHAFVAKSATRMKVFHATGCKHSGASAINSANVVAGSCSDVPLAFIRTP